MPLASSSSVAAYRRQALSGVCDHHQRRDGHVGIVVAGREEPHPQRNLGTPKSASPGTPYLIKVKHNNAAARGTG